MCPKIWAITKYYNKKRSFKIVASSCNTRYKYKITAVLLPNLYNIQSLVLLKFFIAYKKWQKDNDKRARSAQIITGWRKHLCANKNDKQMQRSVEIYNFYIMYIICMYKKTVLRKRNAYAFELNSHTEYECAYIFEYTQM